MSKKLDFSPTTFHGYNLAQAFGMLTPGEYFAVRACAYSLPENARVVNIGAGTGTTSLSIAESRKDVEVFTVDISVGGPLGGLQNEVNAFAPTGLKLPKQILSDSIDAGNDWYAGEIDMLIIDGDHSAEGCRGDFEAWYPHVKDFGLILFHDYNRDVWPDVAAVVGTLEGIRHVMTVDTMYIARKVVLSDVPKSRGRKK